MSAELKITIDDRVLQGLKDSTPRNVGLFLDTEAETMVNGIKLSIQQQSSGRAYRRKGKTHIASRPGDPPNIDMGALINSYTWERDGNNTRRIGTSVDYAEHLEFGNTRGMAPRPHVGPEVERTRARLGADAARFGIVK